MKYSNYSHPKNCTQCFHPMKFSHIFIPWNSVTFSSHEIQSHIYPMKFSHIFSPWNLVNINSIELSGYINLMECTNYSYAVIVSIRWNSVTSSLCNSVTSLSLEIRSHLHPIKLSSYINLMKCTNYSYAVTVLIPWNSVTSSSHEIQWHLHSLKFSHILIPWN